MVRMPDFGKPEKVIFGNLVEGKKQPRRSPHETIVFYTRLTVDWAIIKCTWTISISSPISRKGIYRIFIIIISIKFN